MSLLLAALSALAVDLLRAGLAPNTYAWIQQDVTVLLTGFVLAVMISLYALAGGSSRKQHPDDTG